jgi:hypothetical protein
MRVRGVWATLFCAAAVLAAAQAASANRVHTNPADQAAAKRGVLRLSDLPAVTSWKAEHVSVGAVAAATPSPSCKGFDPKNSDLITTGHAVSQFSAPGAEVQNQVTMLSTERMVELDWQRTMVARLGPCLRQAFLRGGGGLHVVSLQKLPFPKVAPHAAAYRLTYGIEVKGRSTVGAADFIVLAGGRFEITFFLVANLGPRSQLASGEAGMTIIERALAGTVVRRLLKPGPAPKPFTA